MKHWTEPNGIFIINIPIEWQYKNLVIENGIANSPYSFEDYHDPVGCFQLSCYDLLKKGINRSFPIQNNNSEISWFQSRMDDERFDMLLFHAQVDDQLCMAKYIYSSDDRDNNKVHEEIQKVHRALKTFRLVPALERIHASNLDKYDNFQSSLAASYDLVKKSIESESYIELVVLLSNQIDAFLRLAIILKLQLINTTNDIEIKYLFQADNDRGIMERKVYSKALELGIISDDVFGELNNLYDQRNRIMHRYVISLLKTRDIEIISYNYLLLNEKIRLILAGYEEQQFGLGFGIYGRGYSKNSDVDETDIKRLYAMANDKHLLKKFERKV